MFCCGRCGRRQQEGPASSGAPFNPQTSPARILHIGSIRETVLAFLTLPDRDNLSVAVGGTRKHAAAALAAGGIALQAWERAVAERPASLKTRWQGRGARELARLLDQPLLDGRGPAIILFCWIIIFIAGFCLLFVGLFHSGSFLLVVLGLLFLFFPCCCCCCGRVRGEGNGDGAGAGG